MDDSHQKKEVSGFIDYYGLSNWWFKAFDDSERQYIQKRFDTSLSIGGVTLTQGEVMKESRDIVSFLIELSRWFGRAADRHLATTMLEKAESFIDEKTKIRDVHMLYSMMIDLASRIKAPSPELLNDTIRLCENHIFISAEIAQELAKFGPLPKHHGFLQLATIREQEKKHKETISLCKQAQEQGWAGDWAQRIKRCQTRLGDTVVANYAINNSFSVARTAISLKSP